MSYGQKLSQKLSALEQSSDKVPKRKSRETFYGELKKPTIFSLTPTASENLNVLAAEFSLSRSELIEQIARGIISVSYSA
jgi:hypothetical protein